MNGELPNNIEAEIAVLGSITMRPDAIYEVDTLEPSMFYMDRHGIIFEAMRSCMKRRVPADIRMIMDELKRVDKLESVGGFSYLSGLSDRIPVSSRVTHYAKIVIRCAMMRKLISVGGEIAGLGFDESEDYDTIAAKSHKMLMDATTLTGDVGLEPVGNTIDQLYDDMQQSESPGVKVGFRDYDELTGGLHAGDLVILAARPSVGKSSLALCEGFNVAKSGKRVDIFSLEMSKKQNIQRLISMDTGIPLERFRDRKLTEDDLRVAFESMARINAMPINIDDTAGIDIRMIRSRAMRVAMRYGSPAMIIVDYLQLVKDKAYKDRLQEVSSVSRELKALARDLDCTVLALSQLSRNVEGRTSKIPMLSDLRESGQIEQDADIVKFIYREELYDSETDKKGVAEIHIAKHRNGALGVIPMRFDGVTTSFHDLTYRTPEGY